VDDRSNFVMSQKGAPQRILRLFPGTGLMRPDIAHEAHIKPEAPHHRFSQAHATSHPGMVLKLTPFRDRPRAGALLSDITRAVRGTWLPSSSGALPGVVATRVPKVASAESVRRRPVP